MSTTVGPDVTSVTVPTTVTVSSTVLAPTTIRVSTTVPTTVTVLSTATQTVTDPANAPDSPDIPVAPAPESEAGVPQGLVEPPAGRGAYANCTEAKAAGAAPVHRGEPGYSERLDRDGDGVGCES